MGEAVFPSCCFDLRQNYDGGNPSKGLVHKLPHSMPLTLQQATSNPHLPWRLLDTYRQVWVSLLWGHCSFLLGPGTHQVLFVLSKNLFPQSCVGSVIKSHFKVKLPGGSQSLCQIPRLGNLLWVLELS